jgi:hypothetical protein
MDADRSGEAVTDRTADRDIQMLLAVDPSPDFVARVRTRIAANPEPSAWWMSWRFAAACAAAAVVAIAIALSRPRPVDSVLDLAATALPNTSTTMAALKGRPEVGRPFKGRPLTAGQAFPPPLDAAVPEVLIDPREAAALRRLILGARDGRIDLEPALRASTPTAMELPPIDAIAIAPLTIEPLVEEGVRQ